MKRLLTLCALLMGLTTQAQIPSYLPTDGLVGWWPFNGGAEDLNGSEMTFVFNGSTSLGQDRYGNPLSALAFNGDGSASTSNDGSVPQYGEFSVSYWVKRLGGSSAIVALGASNGGSWKSTWGDTACNIRYADGCGNSSQDNVAIPNYSGSWKHVVMTSDGLNDVFQVFVDGQFVGSGTSSNGGACSTAALHLGVEIWSLPEYFIGSVDDVGIWNRILTPSEVTELYEGDPVSTDCLDPQACNFEAVDEECIFPEPNFDCASNCLNDADGDGVCDEYEIAGCTDSSACNYNSEATEEDGTCILPPELDLPESITICEGETALLDAGAGFDSYLWSTGDTTQTIEVNEVGNYSVEVGNAYGLPANGNFPAYLPEDGLVGWWPFNGNANDESGNGNDGIIEGVDLAMDRNGNENKAYTFDSSGDRIDLGDWPLLDDASEMSIHLWLRPEDLGQGLGQNLKPIISKWISAGESGNMNSFLLHLDGGYIRFALEDISGEIFVSEFTPQSLSLNNWHQLVVTVNAELITIYEDGELLGVSPTNHAIIKNSATSLYFGDWYTSINPNYSSFSGDLDDIAIYNRALTPEEVEQLYEAQAFGSCSSTASVQLNVQINGCTDELACNYNLEAGCEDESCTYPAEPYLDCEGNCLNDADNDGVCDDDEIVGCQDETACNYNILATDSGNCIFTEGVCDTCSGETDGTGTVVDNDADNDGVCDDDEIEGCQDETACNYDSAATDAGDCIFPVGCDTCSGEQDGTGTIVDNDADNDGVCDNDEIVGCQDQAACNYNMFATDTGACIFPDDICETCSGQQDGTGTIVDNDADNDGVCDNDEIVGCQDEIACNYDSSATDAGDCEYVDTFNIAGDIAPVVLNETYTYTMTMGSTYAWTCTGGTIESGDGTNTIDVLWTEAGVGELCVTETNADGCVGDEVCLEVEIILTNLNEEMISSINIFPNPASTSVTITVDESLINASYQLFDAQGKLVSEGVLTKTDTTLNTTGFASGNYVVSISNNQGVVRQQIIIER